VISRVGRLFFYESSAFHDVAHSTHASETTRKGSLWHWKAPGRWGGPLGSWHRNLVHSGRGDVGPV